MSSSLLPPRVTPQSSPWNDPGDQVVYDNLRKLERMLDECCDDFFAEDILVPRYGLPPIGSERRQRQLEEQLQQQLSRNSSQGTNKSQELALISSNEAAASVTPATTSPASGSPPH
ncbi:MAG: hypothetical protein Q9173_007312, partial [Seirophora scorigena]